MTSQFKQGDTGPPVATADAEGTEQQARFNAPVQFLRGPLAYVLIAGVLSLSAASFEWPMQSDALPEVLVTLKTAHGLVAMLGLFALACGGVAAIGFGLETLLSVEIIQKFLVVLAALGPFNFAANPAAPTHPATPERNAGIASVQSEYQVGLYGGGNATPPADVFLNQPNGTDMILKNVPWTGEPFDDPPYYGVRGTYWTAAAPKLGAMIDFVHAKSISLRKEKVEQTGTRDGEPVPALEAVEETFTKLEYSHGLNFLTLNAVYRMSGWHRRIVPYIGAGAGLMIPHTEIARKGVDRQNWTYRYEVTGPGFQGFAGVEWRVFPSDRYALFTEYKAGYAVNSSELLEGGTVKTNLWAHQAIVGVSAVAHRPLSGLAP